MKNIIISARLHSISLKTRFILFSWLIILTYCDFSFNSNGKFTILHFTDFHYCEDDTKDQKTEALQRRLLAAVQPDLVIVSGDAVSGCVACASGFFEKCWQKFTQPFVDSHTFYAYTLGNHDAESDLTRKEIVQLDKTNPYSVLRTAEGISETATYRIPIYSSKNPDHLALNVWVFDSGSVGCGEDKNSWGCIEVSHIDWYDQESRKLKDQYGISQVHHVAFYHIPIPEYRNVYNRKEVYGLANEEIECPYVNTGFFSKIQQHGDISAMFVGHDHKNDFGGWYEGVEFVYGRKSGYGSYGDIRGARIIKFEEMTNANGEVEVAREHYVIQEDGHIGTIKEMKKRGDLPQFFCLPANGGFLILLKSIGFFEFLRNFAIILLLCVLLWKCGLRFARCVNNLRPQVRYLWFSLLRLLSPGSLRISQTTQDREDPNFLIILPEIRGPSSELSDVSKAPL